MLAKVINSSIREYPLTRETYLQALEDGLRNDMTSEELAAYDLVRVTVDECPVGASKYTATRLPVLVDGEWHIIWQEDLETPQDIVAVRTRNAERQQRANRDQLIKEVQWRYERHARLARLEQAQVDDLTELDAYVQALADVTDQPGWPFTVTWPTRP